MTDLPAPPASYDASRMNALRHGILSKYSILPWEDGAEYAAMLQALVEEHIPLGPTEEHLVEELAGILWRKRRLRLAEAATMQRGLQATTNSYRDTAKIALLTAPSCKHAPKIEHAIKADAADIRSDLADLEADRRLTNTALGILKRGEPGAYDTALAMVEDSTREAWSNQLTWEPDDYAEDIEPYTPSAESFAIYLNAEILPWYDEERERLESIPAVRAQAMGDALDPDKLVSLARYEVHLDRKFERTLSTLLRLKELRRGAAPETPTAG